MKATRIIAFSNHKGGVGKTTTTSTVGAILAQKGYRVLLIDMDAQANLTSSLIKEPPEESIYDALTGKMSLPVVPVIDNLFLVPASEMLAMIDIELATAISREKILADLLDELPGEKYDYILIDCPTSIGLATLNALTASTDVVVPIVAEILPFNGLKMMNNIVALVRKRLNKKTHITGILITRWEATNLSKTIESDLRKTLGDLVFTNRIRKNVSVAEAPVRKVSITDYAPKSNGATDYKLFTEELLQRINN